MTSPLDRGFLAAAALALAFFVQAWTGSLDKSLTWDEPLYIAAGHSYLATGDFRLIAEAPPLMQQLVGWPLLFMDAPAPQPGDPLWHGERQVSFARKLVFESGLDVERVARWARLVPMLLGSVLVLLVYAWGRALFGSGPALLAAAAVALSPNLVAHAKVATLDLGCAVFMFAAVAALWRALRSPTPASWALCGAAAGLAIASKFTALLLGPIFVVLAGIRWLRDRERLGAGELLGGAAIVSGACFLVIGTVYHFDFTGSRLFDGVSQIYTKMTPGYRFYLLGETSSEPWWYYHLVAFALKVPLALLLLIGLSLGVALRDRRHVEALLFCAVPAAMVFGASFLNPYNLGLRHVLPAFPFLLLMAGLLTAEPAPRWRTIAAWGLVAWALLAAIRVHPHHLAHFNLLAGGPSRAPYLLDDSNIDWGQDLPALARWQRSRPEATPLVVSYFGSAPPASYGVESRPFERSDAVRPAPGYYAMSVHKLVHLRKLSQEHGLDVDWLARYAPIARAGHSIYIYRFTENGGAGAARSPGRAAGGG